MKSGKWIGIALLCFAGLAVTAERLRQDPADNPVQRTDRNSQLAHDYFLTLAHAGRIDIYFEGDSITRRWNQPGFPEFQANWQRNFSGWKAANFGWGLDKTQNVLWRLQNGELDEVNPKIIVLNIGTNNVGTFAPFAGEAETAADIGRGIDSIVKTLHQKAPAATIILMALFPRNDDMAYLPVIAKINAHLATLANGRKIRFLTINDRLANTNGKLFAGIMNPVDRVHPTEKTYQIWADALKPIFTEILGPPAY